MDDLVQVYGRLTAHEFFLELIYANWFASLPEANARQISSDLRSRVWKGYISPDAQQKKVEASGLSMMMDVEVMTDRFLKKVESREAEIRVKLANGRSSPIVPV